MGGRCDCVGSGLITRKYNRGSHHMDGSVESWAPLLLQREGSCRLHCGVWRLAGGRLEGSFPRAEEGEGAQDGRLPCPGGKGRPPFPAGGGGGRHRGPGPAPLQTWLSGSVHTGPWAELPNGDPDGGVKSVGGLSSPPAASSPLLRRPILLPSLLGPQPGAPTHTHLLTGPSMGSIPSGGSTFTVCLPSRGEGQGSGAAGWPMLGSARTLGSWAPGMAAQQGGGSFVQECGPQTRHVFWAHERLARWREPRLLHLGLQVER